MRSGLKVDVEKRVSDVRESLCPPRVRLAVLVLARDPQPRHALKVSQGKA